MSRRVPWEFVVVVIAAAVGAIDAAAGGHGDLAVLFALILGFGLVATARSWSNRMRVSLRADLGSWLARRAADRGTTLDDEASYAIAAFRAGVTPDVESSRNDRV